MNRFINALETLAILSVLITFGTIWLCLMVALVVWMLRKTGFLKSIGME